MRKELYNNATRNGGRVKEWLSSKHPNVNGQQGVWVGLDLFYNRQYKNASYYRRTAMRLIQSQSVGTPHL